MKRLILAVIATLTVSLSAFAGNSDVRDAKSLSSKLWKAPKGSSSALLNQKHDLAIVYGGADVSKKLASETYVG